MKYYIDRPRLYAANNKKCKELCAYIKPFGGYLLPNEIAKDAFITELRLKVKELDAAYPRTKPLKVSSMPLDNYIEAHISVYPEGSPEKPVFTLDIHRIIGTFAFNENKFQLLTNGGHNE